MELYFLGTGAGMPSTKRNVTSVALNLLEETGSYWLFDCGEGTQHQILRSPVKISRLEKVFITHLHGDHLYGLPGLLTSRSYQGGETPLIIYGPPGVRSFVDTALSVSEAHLIYDVEIVEIKEGVVFQDDQFTITAKKLEHRVDSYGYRIEEQDLPGKLNIDKLKRLEVPSGPLYGQLKKGIDIVTPDGTTVKATDVVGPSIPGRTVVIMGDTRPCDAIGELSQNADVLVHEATFADSRKEFAYKYYHTTSSQAAQIAKESNVGTLILTHVSSRYKDEGEEQLLKEAQAEFPNTFLAQDFWSYHIGKK